MKLNLLFPCLLLCVAHIDPVRAAENSTNAPATLRALVQEALAHNRELQFYDAELVAARAGARTAGRLQDLGVSGSVGQKQSRERGGGPVLGSGVAWNVELLQPFEWPGRLGLRKAIANGDVVLAQLGLERFRVALAARVRSQGLTLAGAEEKAQATRLVADRFRALREVLVARDPAGIAPQLEIRVLDATELGLRRRATEAELSAAAALQELMVLLGRPVDGVLTIASSTPPLPPPPSQSVLQAVAATNNFELRQRAMELEQQGFRVRLAQNQRWPAFAIGPQVGVENAMESERKVGLGVSLPLPLWRNNTASVEAARARQEQAATQLAVAQRDVERRVATALNAYDRRRSELERWTPDSVHEFAQAAQLADEHYRLGAVPVTTYVELQKQYLEAVDALLDTRRDALNAAAELEELTGFNLLPVQP